MTRNAIQLMARFSPGRFREAADCIQRLGQKDDGLHGVYFYLYKAVQRWLGPRSRADSGSGRFPRVRPDGLMGYGNMLIGW